MEIEKVQTKETLSNVLNSDIIVAIENLALPESLSEPIANKTHANSVKENIILVDTPTDLSLEAEKHKSLNTPIVLISNNNKIFFWLFYTNPPI